VPEFTKKIDAFHFICSTKYDETGKFDFRIDDVLHMNWFRNKMNSII
jgi:mobilization protein